MACRLALRSRPRASCASGCCGARTSRTWRPARAAIGAFTYCVLVTGGFSRGIQAGAGLPVLDVPSVAIGALGVGFVLLSQVNKVLPPDTETTAPTKGQAWHKNTGNTDAVFRGDVDPVLHVLYPFHLREGAGGQKRTLMNLSLPMKQIYTALSILCLHYERASTMRRKRDLQFQPAGHGISPLLFVVGAPFLWAVLIPLQGALFHVLYGGKYTEVEQLHSVRGRWAPRVGGGSRSRDSVAYLEVSGVYLLCPPSGQRFVPRYRSSRHARTCVRGEWSAALGNPTSFIPSFDVHPVPQVAPDLDTEPDYSFYIKMFSRKSVTKPPVG